MYKIKIGFIVLLSSIALISESKAQEIVIKPSDSITPFFTLDEWISTNSNWGYDSYGLTNIEPFHNLYSSELEASPIIFINGKRYNANWLNKDFFTLTNISSELIDSVVVSPFQKITNGFFTPNGSIEIFLKEADEYIFAEKTLINQVNDPGPHIDTELRSTNVDAINYRERLAISYPKLLNTRLMYSRDRFSYTNRLVYEKEFNPSLFSRTISTTPAGDFRLQRNIDQELFLTNQFNLPNYMVRTNAAYTYSSERYQWYSLTGIEVPASHRVLSGSAIVLPKLESFFQQSQISFKQADTDSLANTLPNTYGVKETTISHSSSFEFKLKHGDLGLHLNNTSYHWNDKITAVSDAAHDVSVILDYSHDADWNMHMIIGNYNLGFEKQRTISSNSLIRLSTYRRDLRANGYNHTFFNRNIGFSNLNRANHVVSNNSDFVNVYSLSEFSSFHSRDNFKIEGSIFTKYYWSFVNTDIDYSFNTTSRQLNSSITYSDDQNLGFVGFNFRTNLNPSPKILIRSALSGHLIRFGNTQFLDNAKNINSIMFSQSLHYKADENALFELNFRYISPRDIVEFESLESNPIFTTAHVRPIYLLNATAKTWLFDRSLALTLALRNLLNSTESYNTNGQFYNMSIQVTASINLNSRLVR